MDLGFEEVITSEKNVIFLYWRNSVLFTDAYVKDWIDNSMIFFEVDNLEGTLRKLIQV
jgi:hypothetical protein